MTATRVIIGFHAVTGRLRADPASLTEIMLDEKRDDARAQGMVVLAQERGVRLRRVAQQRLAGFASEGKHQGVVALVKERASRESLEDLLDRLAAPPLLLALDGVTDPRNLGACLRVADAAGVNAVIVPRDRAAGINATVSKVASGAAETLPYYMVTNLARTLDDLKERNIWVVGADARAPADLHTADLPEAVAWVFGSEGGGMRRLTRERCDLQVRIPMMGQVQSLNVSVAAGICLFESVRRRH
ncbi:MAG: 23S rRNA (guanosine(2251)-2'-O)-methyltransferase RlmB [Betaproteobacteria bacterium RIFCSPLOWO2_02_FULL_62_17]|nr:MAG: 23S rRNA (guanosine(2251)-2'-O)-methyltransferase RlmB [Betaproteobacteria bacterium RIFCSPLOWO2_02_FULL_62_17]